MLGIFSKFSNSIFAKIFLFIIAIPFVFWGMGPMFQGGKLNTIVEIGKEKISTQEFADYVNHYSSNKEKIDINLVEKLFSNFIGEKLIAQELEHFDIRLSDKSLSEIIRSEKIFMKENKFSRTEYEKFLIKNSLNASTLEANISREKKKEQLLDFIGEGIVPPKFLVNIAYDKINQKRNIEVINLNDVFKKKLNFSENQIETYYNQNKDSFIDIYKSVKFVKLNLKNLTGNDEFNDLFFQKIDEIDDLIVEGENLDNILNKFNLETFKSTTFNASGQNKKLETKNELPNELIKKVFNINEMEPTALIEHKDTFYIIELTKTENIQKEITNISVKKEIFLNLEKQTKRKLIAEIVNKINKNNFKKTDFDKLSKNENIVIKKVELENQNDDKILKKELINQIYAFAEKKIIIVTDIGLSENFLIYIDKVENTSINKSSDDYKKYFQLSKDKIVKSLYNTYDTYLANKYKININYKALDRIKKSL